MKKTAIKEKIYDFQKKIVCVDKILQAQPDALVEQIIKEALKNL